MSWMMKRIKINDYDKLKEYLESSKMYEKYKKLMQTEINDVKVMDYNHYGGVTIEGREGRWWVYIRLWYDGGITYDLALWKLDTDTLLELRKEKIIDIR